jgi:hypothetical protein
VLLMHERTINGAAQGLSIRGIGYWTAAAGPPLVSRRCRARAPCCLAGYPGCAYVQNLFVDNIEYRHVIMFRDVTPRTWYYDFDGTIRSLTLKSQGTLW